MKTITNASGALFLGALMAFATGCGKSKALEATEEYEKATCACKDVACITAAAKKYGESSKEMAGAKSGEAEAITKAATNAGQCATKVTMASIPAIPAMGGAPKP